MTTFSNFLKSIYRDGNDGKQFERFVKWFLTHDPEWSTQVEKVWLWDEYPDKWGNHLDLGTDLLFNHKNGDLWAVQAKCYAETTEIDMGHVDSFLSDSSRKAISKRLLITSTNKLGRNAREKIRRQEGERPVTLYMREHFDHAEVDYPSDYKHLRSVKRKEKPTSRPYQEAAISDVVKGFKTADRGQLIMACGTGKTFTTLWIKEKLKSKNTLVLVPSLNLLSQTVREWTFASKSRIDVLCVCSDKSVGKKRDDDEVILSVADVPFPVSSEVVEIRKFLKSSGDKVVFSTYQSSDLVADAQKVRGLAQFDLVVADEAHRCAISGKPDSPFATVLDGKKIRAKKRLFATATPRTYTKSVMTAAEGRGVEVIGMDDETVFGREFHTLTFGEAIKRKPPLLTDYQVVIIGVDDAMIAEWIETRELVTTETGEVETDAETLAAQIGLLKAIKDYNLKRVISFHSRVKRAQIFAEDISAAAEVVDKGNLPKGTIHADFVSGKMSTSDRGDKLKRLKKTGPNEVNLLANARCLSEGVDVPSLDGVAFIDPKNSQVDIIQAVGRAIRLSGKKTVGTIVLPVFIQDGVDAEERIEESNFQPIWWVLNALKAHDRVLVHELDAIRTEMGRRGHTGARTSTLSKVVLDLPVTVGNSFAAALQTHLVERTTASWNFWYGLLQDYFEVHENVDVPARWVENNLPLGNWVSNQRKNYKNNKIPSDCINRLDELGFLWDPLDTVWEGMFETLVAYKDRFSDCNVPVRWKENPELGRWVHTQRRLQKISKLPSDRIRRLDELRFVWDPLDTAWEETFEMLVAYKVRFNNCNVPARWKENPELGRWVHTQRRLQKISKLPSDRIRRLDELRFIWDPLDTVWEEMFEMLVAYKNRFGDCNVPQSWAENSELAKWVQHQRTNHKSSKLVADRIRRLDELRFVWDPLDTAWEETFEMLVAYKVRFNNCNVPARWKENPKLAQWMNTQRVSHKRNKLSIDRFHRLEKLGFVWDQIEATWETHFDELCAYKERFKDLSVPDNWAENPKLAKWVQHQRTKHKKKKLGKDKFHRLEKLGFVWDPSAAAWNDRFNELVAFKDRFKHCNVDGKWAENPELGKWVQHQRTGWKSKKLSADRIRRLDGLGFVWDILEALWEERFKELVAYKSRYGDCTVPLRWKENPKLGSWVSNQRTGYRVGKLSSDRMCRLEKLGFVWSRY